MPPKSDTRPEWLSGADRYAGKFKVATTAELKDAIEAWEALGPDAQSYVQAHLLFLNLQAIGAMYGRTVEIRNGQSKLFEMLTEGLRRVLRQLGLVSTALTEASGGSVEEEPPEQDAGDEPQQRPPR